MEDCRPRDSVVSHGRYANSKQLENVMKYKMLIGVLALTVSTAAFAAEATSPAAKKECCCCEKDEHGKMACCKDKAKESDKSSHEGHDMDGMNHK